MEVTKLMNKARKTKSPFLKNVYRKVAKLWGCVIGRNVVIGNNVGFIHNSVGSVIYTNTVIEDNVKIYQNVTLGKADVLSENASANFIIRKGAVLCAEAKLLCKANETLEVGENSRVAANAVLLNSIPANEVLGGTRKEAKKYI